MVSERSKLVDVRKWSDDAPKIHLALEQRAMNLTRWAKLGVGLAGANTAWLSKSQADVAPQAGSSSPEAVESDTLHRWKAHSMVPGSDRSPEAMSKTSVTQSSGA